MNKIFKCHTAILFTFSIYLFTSMINIPAYSYNLNKRSADIVSDSNLTYNELLSVMTDCVKKNIKKDESGTFYRSDKVVINCIHKMNKEISCVKDLKKGTMCSIIGKKATFSLNMIVSQVVLSSK